METISVTNLSFSYPGSSADSDARMALRDLTLSVPAGTVFTLLGPNGAGKTTLMKLLAGFLTPTSGEARVMGKKPASREAREATAVVFPSRAGFWYNLTGWENLDYFGVLRGLERTDVRTRIDELADSLGMKAFIRRPVSSYSYGMMQRLHLGRALLHRPRVLLLDEPVAHLDPIGTRLFHSIIRGCVNAAGVTVFLLTHQLEEALEISDRLAMLHMGRLAWNEPAEAFRSGRLDLLKEYMRAARPE
jgi:ABC-2 type transport system ATP-binding protein